MDADIGRMIRGYLSADERHMLAPMDDVLVYERAERAEASGQFRRGDQADEFFLRAPIADQILYGNYFQFVLAGEALAILQTGHGAVFVHQLADDSGISQSGHFDEIDRGLGMAGAHEHSALLGLERKDMSRTDEILRARFLIGQGFRSRAS